MVHLVVYTIIAGSVMINSVAGRKVASQGCHKLSEEQCCQYKDGRSKWASNCVLTKNVKAPSRDKSNVCQPEKFVRPKEFGLGSTGFVGDVVDCPIASDLYKSEGLDRCTGIHPCFFGSDACTKEKPCSAYVGDCDSDDQCAGDLVCVITKGPQADFCQPKGTPRPRGKQAAFTKGVKECNSYEYDTGKCTACPGYWYQSCPTKTFEHYGIKLTGRGYESGQKYCGFLMCKVKCKVLTSDYGCGCNRALPVNGWCIDEDLYEVDDSKRRRAESPVLGNLLAEIEGQSDGNDEAGDEKTRVVE